MSKEVEYLISTEIGFKDNFFDKFLANGYYRMQHAMFTCNETQLALDGYEVPVFWLRTIIKNINPSKFGSSIRNKCKNFSVTYKKAAITTEINELYTLYSNHVSFSTSEFCYDYLHQKEIENPFDSYMVEVRENNFLIAVGYFDKGQEAIAGILNIYHPNYAKYSLGKYLILKKIDYAIEHQMSLYYTGYISTGNTKFDYKLFPDENAIQVFLPKEKIWMPYSFLGKDLLAEYYVNNLV